MVKYWQHRVEYEESDEKFLANARWQYGLTVPTFRKALYDLFRSLTRTKRINRAIPDVRAAAEYFVNQECMADVRHNGQEIA